MANVFFRGVAGRVLRDYMAGGQRWLLVETQAGIRFSWLASETQGFAGPAAPVAMAADRNGRELRVGDRVLLEDGQTTRVVRTILGDQIAVENNGNGWVQVVDANRVSYYPVSGMSAQTMAAGAEDAEGRAIHVGDSVQVAGSPTHPLHKVVAIGDGGWLTLRPAAGGALVEMPAREVVARLFGGSAPSHVTMAGVAAQDQNGATLAVGDRVRTPYDEVGIIQRISVENGRVVVWTDMGQDSEVSRGIVGWNAAGLVKVFARATTMANEAAKNIALPSGWQWTNGAAEFVFPMESGRYLVTRYMADQSPSTEDEGTFDLITAALRHADSLVPHNADAAYVWDRKRGFMVARRRA